MLRNRTYVQEQTMPPTHQQYITPRDGSVVAEIEGGCWLANVMAGPQVITYQPPTNLRRWPIKQRLRLLIEKMEFV